MTTTDIQAEGLGNSLVDYIREAGHLHSSGIERALRIVPRHLFVPDTTLQDAYANKAITTKPGPEGGRPASCASQPTVVAMMLGQLGVRPGDRVLEIGAGTGYNAALLAELVGPTGEVTTVDIDPDVAGQARLALEATGYGCVHVVTGDGALGEPGHAPYDRIIVTVGPWDLPPAWFDQLTPGGRLVVPLHWRGQSRSVAFVHQDGVLRAFDSHLCGFIPVIGEGQDGERTGPIAEGVALYWDRDQPIDVDTLQGVLHQRGTTVWSGASVVPNESTDCIWLRLSGTESGTCRFAAAPDAVNSGLCSPAFAYRSPGVVEGNSLAYLTLRGPEPDATERRWELGAIGHGPARSAARRTRVRPDPRLGPKPHRPTRHDRIPGRNTARRADQRPGHEQAVHPARGGVPNTRVIKLTASPTASAVCWPSWLFGDVLDTELADVWSRMTIGRMESFETLQFWTAIHDELSHLADQPLAVDVGLDCQLTTGLSRPGGGRDRGEDAK